MRKSPWKTEHKPIEWDSEVLKAKGAPEADRLIHRELRTKWL
jgi:hypothetical protein